MEISFPDRKANMGMKQKGVGIQFKIFSLKKNEIKKFSAATLRG